MLLMLRLIRRELIRYRLYQLFFIFNLALGLTGLVLINTFKFSIIDYLSTNLRQALTADMQISSRQPFTDRAEQLLLDNLPSGTQVSRKISFFSMLKGPERSRLVNLNGIDNQYPLLGELTTIEGEHLNALIKQQQPLIWLFESDLDKLKLKVGDSVNIGNGSFVVASPLKQAESAMLSFELSPNIFMAQRFIEQTGLLQKGSRVSYSLYAKLPDYLQAQPVAEQIEAALYAELGEEVLLDVDTYEGSNRQLSELLQRSVGYLSMIAVIALFLSAISSLYLYGNYMQRRLQDMAILNTLGYTRFQVMSFYLLLAVIVGILASLIALIISIATLPVVKYLLVNLGLPQIDLQLHWQSVLVAAVFGILGSLACSLPAFARLFGLSPLLLIQQNWQSLTGRYHQVALYLPILALMFSIVVYQSSWRDGVLFFIAFGVVSLLLMLICLACLSLLQIAAWQPTSIGGRIIVRNLYRHRLRTVGCSIALGFGAFLLSLVPQVYSGIQAEIDASDRFNVPSLFLVDIQPEQQQDLKRLIESKGHRLQSTMPLIMARLKEVDGSSPRQSWRNEQLRQNQTDNLDRGVRLTYQSGLNETERLVAGELFEGSYQGDANPDNPIPISLERRFANRINAALGSLLRFDMQGVDVWAQVASIREVRWNSFRPNFFIVFPPGLLEYAPQTYIASVSDMPASQRFDLQDAIVDQFANITVIDIGQLVQTVLTLSERISLAIGVIALLAIIAGLVVIYSIARSAINQRRNEMNLLKVMGIEARRLSRLFVGEFALIAWISSLVGVLLSIATSQLLSWYYFRLAWKVEIFSGVLSVVVIVALSILITLQVSRKVTAQKPWKLLKNN